MDKRSLIASLAQNDEDVAVLRSFLDKEQARSTKNIPTFTKFLTPAQAGMCENLARKLKITDYTFFGIDDEAERKICIFAPDYMDADMLKEEALVLIRCTKSPKDTLTHRDYLGSLIGLGIVRETVGDIFVHERGADIVVLPEIKEFILIHFSRAGRKEISVEVITHSEIDTGLSQGVIKTGSISSLRADCVIAEIWGMSRTLSKEAIDQGRFILNGYECKKPDKEIAEGDKLNLRGKGKAHFLEITGTSKKGKLRYKAEKFG